MFKKTNGKWRLTLRGKDMAAGLFFVFPFLIGFFVLFLPMIIKSITFSFNNMSVGQNGYTLTKAFDNGFEHYIRALTIDPNFNQMLLDSLRDMGLRVPLILIFSFFAATLLNQKYRGRAVARSIFFLPVIMTAGVIANMEATDLLLNTVDPDVIRSADEFGNFLNMAEFLFNYTSLPPSLVMFLSNAVTGIYGVVIASGVQILIFLAGLQGIPPSLFEASNIEGATPWENFWKITFPMISPLILVNSLYTIINSFTSTGNTLMDSIKNTIFIDIKYGLGSAMAWIYFVIIIIVIAIVGSIVSKRVFYMD